MASASLRSSLVLVLLTLSQNTLAQPAPRRVTPVVRRPLNPRRPVPPTPAPTAPVATPPPEVPQIVEVPVVETSPVTVITEPIPPVVVVAEPPPVPPPSPRTENRPVVFDGQLGVQLYARRFWFTDDLFQRLRPYNVTGVPSLTASVDVYPGAIFTTRLASHFGLTASLDWTPYLQSSDAQGRTYDTSSYVFSIGARARYTFSRVELGATIAYVHHEFSIDRGQVDQAPPDGIPNVTYQGVRLGIATRIQILSRLFLTANGSYIAMADFGEIGSPNFFPHISGGGAEASLGAAFALTGGLELRATIDWRRYFLSMNPQVGDRLIAGGAVDDFFGLRALIAWRRLGTTSEHNTAIHQVTE
jgi:hypothetical protein